MVVNSARQSVYNIADTTTTDANARRERILASQTKKGNITEQYRPNPSYCPDDRGNHRFASMNKPYAVPKRAHTNGTAMTNPSAVRPFSVSYGARRSPARYAYGCVTSARARRKSASQGAPPG